MKIITVIQIPKPSLSSKLKKKPFKHAAVFKHIMPTTLHCFCGTIWHSFVAYTRLL